MKVQITIENSVDPPGSYWGTVCINDNLIVDNADSIPELLESIKEQAKSFEGVDVTEWDIKNI